jgi:prefoldin subunit 5
MRELIQEATELSNRLAILDTEIAGLEAQVEELKRFRSNVFEAREELKLKILEARRAVSKVRAARVASA